MDGDSPQIFMSGRLVAAAPGNQDLSHHTQHYKLRRIANWLLLQIPLAPGYTHLNYSNKSPKQN